MEAPKICDFIVDFFFLRISECGNILTFFSTGDLAKISLTKFNWFLALMKEHTIRIIFNSKVVVPSLRHLKLWIVENLHQVSCVSVFWHNKNNEKQKTRWIYVITLTLSFSKFGELLIRSARINSSLWVKQTWFKDTYLRWNNGIGSSRGTLPSTQSSNT